jgi:predicted amidohydrolase
MDKIRVSSTQYLMRPLLSYENFSEQVSGLVDMAADYKSRLVVFPEYFTTQLLTLTKDKAPIHDQVRTLAKNRDRFLEFMTSLSRKRNIYIVGGTIPVLSDDGTTVFNESYVFSPNGKVGVQGKIHMTRFENEEWFVSPHSQLKVFETDFGLMGVNICYDVEFPELARALALHGVSILVVPSCTDDRQGFLRVRYCAQARAIENQLYVIHSGTVGSLPMVPAISLNYGQASILTPSDYSFSRDGILAEGIPNQETMVTGDLDLKKLLEAREQGTVLPLRDSVRTKDVIRNIEKVLL